MQSKFDDWHGCTALHAVRTKNATVPAGLVFRFASCKLFFFFLIGSKIEWENTIGRCLCGAHVHPPPPLHSVFCIQEKSTYPECVLTKWTIAACIFLPYKRIKTTKKFLQFHFQIFFVFFFCFNWKLCNVRWSCAMDYSVRQCENMRQTKNIKCIRHVPNNNQNCVLDGTVIVHTNNVRSPPGKKLQFRHRFFFYFGTQHTAHRAHIHISSIFYARNHPFPPFTHPFSRQHETKQKKSNIYRCFRSLSVNISFCT